LLNGEINVLIIKRIGLICVLSLLIWEIPLSGAEVELPGSLLKFVSYLKSYEATEKNLIYHLNEILLFHQLPSLEEIRKRYYSGVTKLRERNFYRKQAQLAYRIALPMAFPYRIRRIMTAHREMKEMLRNLGKTPDQKVTYNLRNPQEFLTAEALLKAAGLILSVDNQKNYRVVETYSHPEYDANHYYQMLGLDTWKLERQLNRSHRLELEIQKFTVHIPWEYDFLSAITGLDLTVENFAEAITSEPRLKLLLGILFRLSDREIDYISGMAPGMDAWKKIYGSERFLCGMFILSHALRVKDGRILYPGAPDPLAKQFWQRAAGIDMEQYPLQFLEELATKDDGKLNYFFTFAFFLPKKSQQAVLFNFDLQKFQEIYPLVKLDKQEKIRGLEIPELQNQGFFTLIYALETGSAKILFPGGTAAWARALGLNQSDGRSGNLEFDVLKHLLKESKKNRSLKHFIPVYCKFHHRPNLLVPQTIRAFYENYGKYNIVIDFIERIPIKKPQTALNLLFWAKSWENADCSTREKESMVGVFQCLLEILAQKAKTLPDQYPYDDLVEELIKIPIRATTLYDNVFRFFSNNLGIALREGSADEAFFNFLLPGDPEVTIHKQKYNLAFRPIQKKELTKILKNQKTANLNHLLKINRLLTALQTSKTEADHKKFGKQLYDSCRQLSLLEFEPFKINAYLKHLLMNHYGVKLFERIHRLMKKKMKNAPQPEIDEIVAKIKGESLLQELKHYLVTCLYGMTLKDSQLQVFLNPNFTRFHDFSWASEGTPWNSSEISRVFKKKTGYHFRGGLSRLQISLAYPFSDHVLGRELDYEPTQSVPIIYNNLDLFPRPLIRRGLEYNGLLIKFAEELLEQAGEDPLLKKTLREELARITSGNHYRNVVSFLEDYTAKGKRSMEQPIYFSELLNLGETFFHKKKFLKRFSRNQRLEAFREPGLYHRMQEEMNRLGSIYYHTFGTLKPYRYKLFPTPLSVFFKARWTTAEMNAELKVKAAYLLYLNRFPPQLLGGVIYRYLYLAADLFFRSTRIDFHKTYYMYSVLSYLYLNQIYDDMRKLGIMRIR